MATTYTKVRTSTFTATNLLIDADTAGLAIAAAYDAHLVRDHHDGGLEPHDPYVAEPEVRFINTVRPDVEQRIISISNDPIGGHQPVAMHLRTTARHDPIVTILGLLPTDIIDALDPGGPVWSRTPARGDRIVLPAGTPIRSMHPKVDGWQPSKRRQTITVHHASAYDRTVSWAGAGGYWRDAPYDRARPAGART